jgi:hypothetical protein
LNLIACDLAAVATFVFEAAGANIESLTLFVWECQCVQGCRLVFPS